MLLTSFFLCDLGSNMAILLPADTPSLALKSRLRTWPQRRAAGKAEPRKVPPTRVRQQPPGQL